jgi:hypothetical protein
MVEVRVENNWNYGSGIPKNWDGIRPHRRGYLPWSLRIQNKTA